MNTIGFNTNDSKAEAAEILQKEKQPANCGKAINNVVTVMVQSFPTTTTNSTLMKVTEFLLTVNTTEAAELLPKL